MPFHEVEDWSDAYANSPHISGGGDYPARRVAEAAAFRHRMKAQGRARLDLVYAQAERNVFDLFLPAGPALGLLVFAHGGFWPAFDKSSWSHFAEGPTDAGFAVALPSYRLAPSVRIADIGRAIGAAVNRCADEISGPIVLVGHSAGGHLVTRQICRDSTLDAAVAERIRHVVSISGLHDLRPLMKAEMTGKLKLDMTETYAESVVGRVAYLFAVDAGSFPLDHQRDILIIDIQYLFLKPESKTPSFLPSNSNYGPSLKNLGAPGPAFISRPASSIGGHNMLISR